MQSEATIPIVSEIVQPSSNISISFVNEDEFSQSEEMEKESLVTHTGRLTSSLMISYRLLSSRRCRSFI